MSETAATQTSSASKTPPPVDPDSALLQGGPAGEHGKPMPKQGDPHPDLQTTPTTTSQPKYELNGKTFASAEDMSRYVADLERKVIEVPVTAPQPTSQIQPQVEMVDGMPIDQALFANPTKVLKYFEDKAERRFEEKMSQTEMKTKFWADFYNQNPDLRGKEDIINGAIVLNPEWGKLKLPEFAKAVSENVRLSLKKIGYTGGVEVRQGNSATLSPSGPSAPVVEQERTQTNLVDEMNAARQKRLKAKAK